MEIGIGGLGLEEAESLSLCHWSGGGGGVLVLELASESGGGGRRVGWWWWRRGRGVGMTMR